MNKEQQDRLWNELSEEQKQEYREWYKESSSIEPVSEFDKGKLYGAELIFGSHNLNPEPQIRIWDDIIASLSDAKEDEYYSNKFDNYVLVRNVVPCSDKIKQKLEATYRISKLIELGYGGMVSEEEWRNENTEKWSVLNNHNFGDFDIVKMTIGYGWKSFISFHTEQQAREFMSHESNRELVEMYYCL